MGDGPARTITVETLNSFVPGTLLELVGVRYTAIDDGLVRAELEVRPQLLAPNGYLHGGAVVALADSACGSGTMLHLPEGATGFTTIELKANFLGTAREGVVAAEARLVHAGRTTQLWDAHVSQGERRLAAFRCTQLLLRR